MAGCPVEIERKYLIAYPDTELLRKAGERFTEVVTKTQVYDSVNSKSAYMRSKNPAVKYLVS